MLPSPNPPPSPCGRCWAWWALCSVGGDGTGNRSGPHTSTKSPSPVPQRRTSLFYRGSSMNDQRKGRPPSPALSTRWPSRLGHRLTVEFPSPTDHAAAPDGDRPDVPVRRMVPGRPIPRGPPKPQGLPGPPPGATSCYRGGVHWFLRVPAALAVRWDENGGERRWRVSPTFPRSPLPPSRER